MDALVHKRSSVAGPAAAPGGLFIIRPIPVPAHMDGAVGQTSEASLIQCGAHALHGEIKAILVADGHLAPRLPGPINDPVRIRHGHGHGFFDDHVEPRIEAGQGNFRMNPGIGRNGGEFQFRMFGEHLTVIGITRRASGVTGLLKEKVNMFRDKVTDRNELQPVVHDGFDVVDGNAAAADECVFHSGSLLQSVSIICSRTLVCTRKS